MADLKKFSDILVSTYMSGFFNRLSQKYEIKVENIEKEWTLHMKSKGDVLPKVKNLKKINNMIKQDECIAIVKSGLHKGEKCGKSGCKRHTNKIFLDIKPAGCLPQRRRIATGTIPISGNRWRTEIRGKLYLMNKDGEVYAKCSSKDESIPLKTSDVAVLKASGITVNYSNMEDVKEAKEEKNKSHLNEYEEDEYEASESDVD
jgi:hypothetical protein